MYSCMFVYTWVLFRPWVCNSSECGCVFYSCWCSLVKWVPVLQQLTCNVLFRCCLFLSVQLLPRSFTFVCLCFCFLNQAYTEIWQNIFKKRKKKNYTHMQYISNRKQICLLVGSGTFFAACSWHEHWHTCDILTDLVGFLVNGFTVCVFRLGTGAFLDARKAPDPICVQ